MSPLLDMKILLLTLPTVIGLVFEAGLKKLGIRKSNANKSLVYEGSEKGTVGNA